MSIIFMEKIEKVRLKLYNRCKYLLKIKKIWDWDW